MTIDETIVKMIGKLLREDRTRFNPFLAKTEESIEEVIVNLIESKIVMIVRMIVSIGEIVEMIDKMTEETIVTIAKTDAKKIVITVAIAAIKLTKLF